MKKKIKDIALLNTIMSVLLQIVTIINGFIVPRLILQTFGSEVNGLVSSLNQFLNYISLLEGGVNGVIMASLYKPLHDNDIKKRDSIIVTSQKFFKKISYIFIVYTLILTIIYPLIVKSQYSFAFVSSLILILSINLFSQYCFSLTYQNLLQADKKVYVTSFIQIVCSILNAILVIITIRVFPEIHVVKIASAMVYIIQPIFFNIYVDKKYNIEKKAKEDKNLIKNRWNGLWINIAAFIHNNTDITILSILTNLKDVSIYSIYMLVINGIQRLLNGIYNGMNPSIGHALYDEDKKHLNSLVNQLEFITFFSSFYLYTITAILITPFVLIYTKNINDANYNQQMLGIILVLAQLVYSIRNTSNCVAYNANKFRDLTKYAVTETTINIILSLVLVFKFGMVGVAVATLIAMTYRTIAQEFYLKNHVVNRSSKNFFKKFLLFGIGSIIVILLDNYVIKIPKNSILLWIGNTILYCIILLIIYLIISKIFFKDELDAIIKRIFPKDKDKNSK